MRRIATYFVFPTVVIGFSAACWALMHSGWAPMHAYSITTTGCFFLLLVLERLLPYRADWNENDGQIANDVGHTLIGTVVGARLGHLVNDFIFVGLAGLLLSRTGELWPRSWPFPAQVVLVFLVADFGRYLQHRMHHRFTFAWRFHVLHHDCDRLATLKNARSHLVERVLQAMFMYGPLLVLGAPSDVTFWYLTINSFVGLLDHSNVDARLGVLEWLINGPASHRIHHSLDLVEGNRNFGSALVLWDQLFGTWQNPVGGVGIARPGVATQEPKGFFAQLLVPFAPALRDRATPR